MDSWAIFWSWVLVIGFTMFFGLAVIVSIRGFMDIRTMFKDLRKRQDRGGN